MGKRFMLVMNDLKVKSSHLMVELDGGVMIYYWELAKIAIFQLLLTAKVIIDEVIFQPM